MPNLAVDITIFLQFLKNRTIWSLSNLRCVTQTRGSILSQGISLDDFGQSYSLSLVYFNDCCEEKKQLLCFQLQSKKWSINACISENLEAWGMDWLLHQKKYWQTTMSCFLFNIIVRIIFSLLRQWPKRRDVIGDLPGS